jgi:hypothetical protein
VQRVGVFEVYVCLLAGDKQLEMHSDMSEVHEWRNEWQNVFREYLLPFGTEYWVFFLLFMYI